MDVDIEEKFYFGSENFVDYAGERKNEWLKHCHRELANLTGNGIVEELEVTSIPAGATILKSYWKFIFHYDRSLDSHILVEDEEQTERMESAGQYTPTKNYDTLKCLLCMGGINGLEMRIMKVKKAYDNAIDSEIYVRPPEEPEFVKSKEWRVKKAMRGMHQYSMLWYQRISQYLEGQGLCKSSIDGCLFSGEGCHALVHGDEILICGGDRRVVDSMMKGIEDEYGSVEVVCDGFCERPIQFSNSTIRYEKGKIYISLQKVLETWGNDNNSFGDCFIVVPLTAPFKVGSDISYVMSEDWQRRFRELLYPLREFSQVLRYDLSSATTQLERCLISGVKDNHYEEIRYSLSYAKRSRNLGLEFTAGNKEKMSMLIPSDINKCGEKYELVSFVSTCRYRAGDLVYGYMTMLNGNLIKWGSMKATFRTRDLEFATEYVAMKEAMKSNVEIEKILNEVGVDVGATIICSEYPEAISGARGGKSGIIGKEDGYVMGQEVLEECYRYVRDVNKNNKYEFKVIKKEKNVGRLMSYVLGLEEFQHYMRLVDEDFDNHWEEEQKKEKEKEEKEEIERDTTEMIGKLSV
ncbi:hypothetical protein B5S30_g5459 [[Candida] boidinii]|nr:hypothetical protein B5S30_g5459 [[Candida] boidinii]